MSLSINTNEINAIFVKCCGKCRIKDYTYDEDNEEYHLNITSDVGNAYLMVIDINDNNLRFLYEKNGISYAVQHNIKSSWKEEE